ncbi:thiopurine S-methyltransferase [Marinomonas balearica]|uniref:Thiopurine S-methyltransferase n=1 Tax=Marinomonas balearica TaxID=491947 RepID=A0A4R6MDD5_9GAMM|nr:thiopurine S-methyltransferase [Marinomonas balearica]TDO99396.1 thiopurine S-methyltransferase [Marinomonas balearica]
MITNEFWLDRWKAGRIGFHEDEVSPLLTFYWRSLPRGSRVLVPLCGKSNDLIWLAEQGYDVVGVELSSLAVVEFFGDNDLEYTTESTPLGKMHRACDMALSIFEGDIFDFDEINFDACYDRAAMVAMPPSSRQHYVDKVSACLRPKAYILVIALYHDGDITDPPFSVSDDEVAALWKRDIHKIASEDLVQTNIRYKEKNHAFFEESVWQVLPD